MFKNKVIDMKVLWKNKYYIDMKSDSYMRLIIVINYFNRVLITVSTIIHIIYCYNQYWTVIMIINF